MSVKHQKACSRSSEREQWSEKALCRTQALVLPGRIVSFPSVGKELSAWRPAGQRRVWGGRQDWASLPGADNGGKGDCSTQVRKSQVENLGT